MLPWALACASSGLVLASELANCLQMAAKTDMVSRSARPKQMVYRASNTAQLGDALAQILLPSVLFCSGRKADIWSLGCTVLEMLTGKHPWPDYDNQWAVMLAITQTETGPPRPPGISSSLSDFLDQCFKVGSCFEQLEIDRVFACCGLSPHNLILWGAHEVCRA